MSNRPFDLVHSDVWGLAPFVSKGKLCYYVTFIDDFSCFTWVYFLDSRAQVLTAYQNFATMVCTHFDSPIRVFRADSAGEYLSRALCQFLADQDIIPQYSCTGGHAQNSVIERRHRHLLKTTRALLLTSSVLDRSCVYNCLPCEHSTLYCSTWCHSS
jgi:transposase InsO family protein